MLIKLDWSCTSKIISKPMTQCPIKSNKLEIKCQSKSFGCYEKGLEMSVLLPFKYKFTGDIQGHLLDFSNSLMAWL